MTALVETFTHTNSAGAISADQTWTLLPNSGTAQLGIVSNRVENADTAIVHQFARCDDAAANSADFSVSITIPALPASPAGVLHIGALARMSAAGGASGYEFRLVWASGVQQALLFAIDSAGAETQLGATVDLSTFSITPATGDIMRINVAGTTIKGYYTPTGGSETLVNTRTDSTYATGTLGGLHMIRTSTSDTAAIDDWTIDPIAGGLTEAFTHEDWTARVSALYWWTQFPSAGTPQLGIVSNRVENADTAASVHQIARCDTAIATSADYSVSLALPALPASPVGTLQIGPMARMANTGGGSGYEFRLTYATGVAQANLYQIDNPYAETLLGAAVDLSTFSITPAAGDVMRLDVAAGTIKGYYTPTGGVETLVNTRSDSTYQTGTLGGFQMLRTSTSDVAAVDGWNINPATAGEPTETATFSVPTKTKIVDASVLAAFDPDWFWPDSGLGIIDNYNATYSFIASVGGASQTGEPGRAIGTLANPFSVSSVKATISGKLDAPDSTVANFSYMGGGPVYRDPSTGMLIQFTHLERIINGSYPGLQYYGWEGVLKSTDGGATWTDCGTIITPYHTYTELAAALPGGWTNFWNGDPGWCPWVIVGSYFYIWYWDCDGDPTQAGVGLFGDPQGACLARALVSEVVAAALTDTVSTWHKYNAGTWTEEGIRGRGTRIVNEISFSVTYNTYRSKFIMLMPFVSGSDLVFRYRESDDGIVWGPRQDLITAHAADIHVYPTMFSPTRPQLYQTGKEFYLISKEYVAGHVNRFSIVLDGDPEVFDAPLLTALHAVAGDRGD